MSLVLVDFLLIHRECSFELNALFNPLDTRRKLNVYNTFCLRSMSRGLVFGSSHVQPVLTYSTSTMETTEQLVKSAQI